MTIFNPVPIPAASPQQGTGILPFNPLPSPPLHQPMYNPVQGKPELPTQQGNMPTPSAPFFTPIVGQQHPSQPNLFQPQIATPYTSTDTPKCPAISFGFGGSIAIGFNMADQPAEIAELSIRTALDGTCTSALAETTEQGRSIVEWNNAKLGPLDRSTPKEPILNYLQNEIVSCPGTPLGESMAMLLDALRCGVNDYGDYKSCWSILLNRLSVAATPNTTPEKGAELSDAEKMAAVQSLLIRGNSADALAEAKAYGMWPLAFIIGKQLGSIDAVIEEYSERVLGAGDPLKTIALLSCGHIEKVCSPFPTSVVSRWRENVAAILTYAKNAKFMQDPNASRIVNVVGELGDTLWQSTGNFCAAHLCYLLAEHNFGFVDNPNSRIVLLMGDHKVNPDKFYTPQSFYATEIFEYSKMLSNPLFVLPQLFPFKFLFALHLAELGELEKARKYLEGIQSHYTISPNALLRLVVEQSAQFIDHALSPKNESQGGFLSKLKSIFERSSSTQPQLATPQKQPQQPPTQPPAQQNQPQPHYQQPFMQQLASPSLATPANKGYATGSAMPSEEHSKPAKEEPITTPLKPKKEQEAHKELPKTKNHWSIFSWFKKPVANVILPDDSQDSIVWDEATHSWRDKNAVGTPVEKDNGPPPMASCVSPAPASAAPPSGIAPSAAVPASGPSQPAAAGHGGTLNTPPLAAQAATPIATGGGRRRRYIDPLTQQVRTEQQGTTPLLQPTGFQPSGLGLSSSPIIFFFLCFNFVYHP